MNDTVGLEQTGRPPPEPLMRRYRPEDLSVLTPEEWARWVGPFGAGFGDMDGARRAWPTIRLSVAWQLLYRIEPELYERLVAGERIHSEIVDRLPRADLAVEVGAGAGRLTLSLARGAGHVIAVEPAAPLRHRLAARMSEEEVANVEVVGGFFDDLPQADASADLVVACSSFTVEAGHGGRAGLDEMERVCRPGGMVAVIWPDRPRWLEGQGYGHELFEGEAEVDFGSLDEAVAVARIFYPDAVETIRSAGRAAVPYEVLGRRRPQDLCWRRIEP